VLLSKRDLEALERALEILSNTDDVRHVTEKIANLIAAATANDYAAA
jgi:PHD/YefM family antitoxin component YafN of YafNO toxin-antitoxin module